jgi:hypothetical protein
MDGSHNRNILGVIGVDCHSLGWLQLPTARSKRGLEAWKRLGSLLDCFIVVRYSYHYRWRIRTMDRAQNVRMTSLDTGTRRPQILFLSSVHLDDDNPNHGGRRSSLAAVAATPLCG